METLPLERGNVMEKVTVATDPFPPFFRGSFAVLIGLQLWFAENETSLQ